jgi:integrase
MPNVRFYILASKVNKKGFVPIVANVSIDYKDIKKTTGLRVKPYHWNPNPREENGVLLYVRRPRPDQPDNNYKAINQELKKFADNARAYFVQCEENDVKITPELIRQYFAGKKKTFAPKAKNFWDAVDEYMKLVTLEMETTTHRTKKTFFKFLRTFENDTGFQISFDRMNMKFFDRYKLYVLDELDLSWNYLSVQTRSLKAFLNWAAERNYYKGHEHRNFKVSEKGITIVALDYQELMKLFNHEFKDKTHAKARDIFCFGCFTGLRISDVLKLNIEHVNDGMIHLIIQKTKESLSVPILPETQQIIDRYSEQYRLLPRMTEQRINTYIKECARIAGISVSVKIKSHPKGQMKEETYPKHELIHTHTARKTFVTLAYERGLDLKMIKSITGIKSNATLDKYLKVDEGTKKEKMLGAWGKKKENE